MAKCTNCNGTGIVGEGRLGFICGKCKGIGFVDEPRPKKKEQTNEEWFCGLSTEEKAKWLEDKMIWSAKEQGTFTAKGWEKWLKEKHE